MRRLILGVLLFSAFTARASEVVRIAPWELHSSFWMSLHHRLIEDAVRPKSRDLRPMPADGQKVWNEAVAAYRTAIGNDDPVFARVVVVTNDALSQVADDAVELAIDAPLSEALNKAAPVYRKSSWRADDDANRFFIGYASALLREAGTPLVRAHEAVYGSPWPELIRVYVSPYGGEFGAYTMTGRAGGPMTIMSSRDSGYQGLRALEMLLHESSHTVVSPNRGPIAEMLAASAKAHDTNIPPQLWHAMIFSTSSELTRRFLAEHGTADFVPSSQDLFTRVWPQYRTAFEQIWIPYVAGKGTLKETIDALVSTLGQSH